MGSLRTQVVSEGKGKSLYGVKDMYKATACRTSHQLATMQVKSAHLSPHLTLTTFFRLQLKPHSYRLLGLLQNHLMYEISKIEENIDKLIYYSQSTGVVENTYCQLL